MPSQGVRRAPAVPARPRQKASPASEPEEHRGRTAPSRRLAAAAETTAKSDRSCQERSLPRRRQAAYGSVETSTRSPRATYWRPAGPRSAWCSQSICALQTSASAGWPEHPARHRPKKRFPRREQRQNWRCGYQAGKSFSQSRYPRDPEKRERTERASAESNAIASSVSRLPVRFP